MRLFIRVAAGLFAALWAVPGFGIVDLTVTIAPDAEWEPVALLDGGWGLFVTAFVVAGLVLVALRPRLARHIAGQLTGMAVLVGASALIGHEYTVWWMLLALLLPAGLLAGLDRLCGAPVVAGRCGSDAAWARHTLVGLAVLGAVPWLVYAADMYAANRARRWPTEITNDVNHWAIQGAFAVALVLFILLAAVRPSLRRFNAVRAGVSAAYLGICSLRFPDVAAALPTLWAVLAVIWGVALVGVGAAVRPSRNVNEQVA